MVLLKQIKTIEELNELNARGLLSSGAYDTAMKGLLQGKPLFLLIPEGSDSDNVKEILKELEELGTIQKSDKNGLD